MMKEFICKILTGDRDGTTLWKIPISQIEYTPILDPAEGVAIASLAENILHCGLLQPILVYRVKGMIGEKTIYRLISGRRRVEALRMLGRTQIDCIVVRCDAEQAQVLSISDNLLYREPNVFELAGQLKQMKADGIDSSRLAAMFALSVDRLDELISILDMPEEEIRWMKMIGASRYDVLRLNKLSDGMRRLVLRKCLEESGRSLTDLLDSSPDVTCSVSQPVVKIGCCDTRLFLNTIDRAIETMKNAGFSVQCEQSEGVDGYSLKLKLSKASKNSPAFNQPKNVSRETSKETPKRMRLSSALSIFEAIAEDEKMYAENVSRETSTAERTVKENVEKLELCID